MVRHMRVMQKGMPIAVDVAEKGFMMGVKVYSLLLKTGGGTFKRLIRRACSVTISMNISLTNL